MGLGYPEDTVRFLVPVVIRRSARSWTVMAPHERSEICAHSLNQPGLRREARRDLFSGRFAGLGLNDRDN